MRPPVLLLLLAALGAAAPMTALGDPGGGHEHGGGGGWRGGGGGHGGGFERGGPAYERGGGPYERGGPGDGGGRWRGEGPPQPESYPGARYPAPEGGAFYGEPPRSRNSNSLGRGYGEQQDEAREGVRHGGYQPMQSVMETIRRRTPGRPLDAGLEQAPDGRPVYRVRWGAANGRRIDYIIDARTGAILETEGQ